MRRIAPLFTMALLAAATLASLAWDPVPPPEGAGRPGPRATLLTLDLQGPSSVGENSTEGYILVARYDDGSSVEVTDRAAWSVDSPWASVTRGVLTVAAVPGERKATLNAWFTDGLSLKAARTVILAGPMERPGATEGGPAGSFSAQDRELSAKGRGAGWGT